MELKINNISKTYLNGVAALRNINLKIPKGMFGLLGPNGAGKSTLMRILATLQSPNEGSIFLGDIDIINEKKEIRKTLGYLPQEFGLYPKASAESLLDHFISLKGFSKKKSRKLLVESLLKKVNLWEVRHQKLGGFSGGMRQRFGIAVALIGNPKLLIVDEPTAGLDPTERVRLLNLLSELGENGVVLLSTHIVEDVSELCTNMAIINKGEILLEAQPIAATKLLKGKIWRLMIEKNELPEVEKNFEVVSTKLFSGKTVVHIYSDIHPANGFEMVEPDLEDVYFCTMSGFMGNGKMIKDSLL